MLQAIVFSLQSSSQSKHSFQKKVKLNGAKVPFSPSHISNKKLSFHSEDKDKSVRYQKDSLNMNYSEVIQNNRLKFIDLVANIRKLTFNKDFYGRSSEVDPIVLAIGSALGRKHKLRSMENSVEFIIMDDRSFYSGFPYVLYFRF